ncbi:MAG: shikimate kinase [Clostridia bacterium]|nr:shikimate kinase [Clostridia bacterium]MBQ2948301.1 shikimate kinase [Clostridia bacterium]MBQ4608290.1 shikimate kinase [Clostridia bacterium]MBQ6859673.1 shikimate kinase [Clostridia bacterium]MBQ7052918.1 shikimate kinase [Clostridia bacterium]
MQRHLFLIGMMGSGKTTIGRLLADMLHVPLIDLDEAIEHYEGRTIPEIFAAEGDAGFRLCETAALECSIDEPPCVIATGGGIVTREENIAIMRRHGLVVWLNRPLEDMIADVRQDTRPNLAGDKAERMRTLFAQREALYRRAAHIEWTCARPAGESAALLAETLCAWNGLDG